jgi:D-glycero-beta-D-manno-heptose-7-phosphate kinase
MEDFQKLFDSFSTLRVGVIGDVMLDTYIWGKVDRISPEAPVPVVSLEKKEYRVGGAGNVALNCKALGSQVFILSMIGDDKDGLLLEELLIESMIDTSFLLKSHDRITTNKTRIISRNQQMMRLDSENSSDLSEKNEELVLQKVRSFIQTSDPHLIIFEDYNKGILTEKIIFEVTSLCKQAGILTAVDPKRKNFFTYHHADIFKPNLKEVKEGLNLLVDEINLPILNSIHVELKNILEHKVSFITLSEKGVFYQQDGKFSLIPSHLRNIADVSGAGDTVIAVASLVYAATKNAHLMAEVANIAGGLACESVGAVAIDKEKLLHECELLLS